MYADGTLIMSVIYSILIFEIHILKFKLIAIRITITIELELYINIYIL